MPFSDKMTAARHYPERHFHSVSTPRFGSETASQPDSRNCGAIDCTNGWLMPWKSRTRPVFEQEWGCCSACIASLVQAAVRRETGDDVQAGAAAAAPRHRVPLGLVLLAQGWITNAQLDTALQSQRASGRGRIGDWLSQTCGIEEEQITRGLGMQWNCPLLALEDFSPNAMALLMPKRFIVEFGLLPVRVTASSGLHLAFEQRMDAATAIAVGIMTGLNVESGLLAGTQFEAARSALLAAEGVPVTMSLVRDAQALTGAIVAAIEKRPPAQARLVRVRQYFWLRTWLEAGSLGAGGGVGNPPSRPGSVEDHLFMMSPHRSA